MTTLETLTEKLHEQPLPAGWRMVRLGDLIAEAQAGFASGARDPDGVIQLRMNNVGTRGNLVWDEVLRVPADAATVEQFRLIPGDVMFNNTNSTELVGKSALFEGYEEPVVFSNHFTRIRPKPGILLPEFLAAWLNQQWLNGIFANICNRWVGQSAVKGDRLLKIDFPLPPLPEQQRIAAILREQMAAVEKARAAAEARLEAVKSLPAAFLRQVFPQPGQPLPKGWQWRKFNEITVAIDYGYTASAAPDIKSPKFLRITDIQDGQVNWQKVPGCQAAHDDIAAYRLMDGDIVFARTGATTGKSLLIRKPPEAIFASYLIRVRARTEHVLAEFLYGFFQSDAYWHQIAAGVRGGAQGGFNASMLAALMVPVAPIAEQHRITLSWTERSAALQMIRAAAEAELDAINALPAALLRRAFSGGL